MVDLVDFYYKLVRAGKLDIEAVPAKYRESVRERLKEVSDV